MDSFLDSCGARQTKFRLPNESLVRKKKRRIGAGGLVKLGNLVVVEVDARRAAGSATLRSNKNGAAAQQGQ
jgi:hypothetical protein